MALHRIIPIHWGPREYLAIGCHSPSFTKALPEGQKVLQALEVRALESRSSACAGPPGSTLGQSRSTSAGAMARELARYFGER
jgi:hypothetical protein